MFGLGLFIELFYWFTNWFIIILLFYIIIIIILFTNYDYIFIWIINSITWLIYYLDYHFNYLIDLLFGLSFQLFDSILIENYPQKYNSNQIEPMDIDFINPTNSVITTTTANMINYQQPTTIIQWIENFGKFIK